MKFKATILFALCLALGLTACAPKAPDAPAEPEAPAGIYTPGAYEATAQGYGGEVKVTITVDDNTITDCVIVGDSETAGIGSNAVEQMPATIIAANSAEVDIVTSATNTSNAIIAAATEALAAAAK